MRKVSTKYVKAGDKLGKSLYTKNGSLLLREGTVFTPRIISTLKKMGINYVYIDDDLLADVYVDDVILDETRAEAMEVVSQVFTYTRFSPSQKGLLLQEKLIDIVEKIIEELLTSRQAVVELADIRSADSYTFAHSVNAAVLALITGIELGLDRKNLKELGLGTILHDVGKVFIPGEILNKPDKLTAEEMAVVQKHTLDGFNILEKNGLDVNIAKVALEHHERMDGSGYPYGLKGDSISLHARIASLVDIYDALTSERSYRKAFPPHEAVEYIAGSGGYQLDFEVVRAFFKHIAAYPIGTFVQLDNGEIAVSIHTTIGQPMRPVVRVIFDENWNKLSEAYEIDLSQKPLIAIKRYIPENEVEEMASQNQELKRYMTEFYK